MCHLHKVNSSLQSNEVWPFLSPYPTLRQVAVPKDSFPIKAKCYETYGFYENELHVIPYLDIYIMIMMMLFSKLFLW